MTAAILGVIGFIALFTIAGLVPLERRSCHGDCTAASVADCGACPFGPAEDHGDDGAKGAMGSRTTAGGAGPFDATHERR
jgi:hypothetical protein